MAVSIMTHKDFCLNKYKNTSVPSLINRKLVIHKQLERAPRTYCVYSDLHGSYEKYLYWLKNGMGYFKIAISEILGPSYSDTIYEEYIKLFVLINRTKLDAIDKHIKDGSEKWDVKDFFMEKVPYKYIETLKKLENTGLSKRRIIEDILKILRLITRGDEHRVMKYLPSMYLENTIKLYYKEERTSYYSLLNGIIENERIYNITTSQIIKLVLLNTFDKHLNLGDTFDRGNGADKLIKLYKAYFGQTSGTSPLHYIWGNHDILWLGAAIGNPICCMTALRISMRYNNVDFLFRYGFNLDKLRDLALSHYKETPTGEYIKESNSDLWPKEVAAKMTKVLLVLESKLTVTCLNQASEIPGDIDYKPYIKHYSDLIDLIPSGIKENPAEWKKFIKENPLYTDAFFPSVKKKNPEALTKEEKAVVNDIIKQFTTLPKLQADIKWMFEKGETYRVMDNTVYFHAAIPATEDMELEEVKGMKGKVLLDYVQRDLKRISESYFAGKEITIREKMFFWYLWCGKTSPFFCKSKMATLERAIFDKEEASKNDITSWKEFTNPYYKFIRDDQFLNKLLTEFHADKICMGHTPVKSIEQGILSNNLRAFIIDGGASSAYGDKGAILINTPDFTYITFHPSLEELKKAEKEDRLPGMKIEPLAEKKNLKLRHMDKGYFLRRELEAINELLEPKLDIFCDKYFY